jgi:hypothetical protein
VIGWLATIGVAEWFYAVAEVEPPGWDTLSYSIKAAYFWEEITHGRFQNLLALAPSLRPPGTVLMSYPFGFSIYFQAFYFRSVFFPLVLLVGAVYIVGYYREMPDAAKWLLAVLAIAIAGMPILFQFQGNDPNTAIITWGHVDNFLAGVAAVAVASCMRSARTHSTWWAAAAIFAAAFCFMIKPAGLLVMMLVGASWLLLITFQVRWNLFRLWQETVLRRFCVVCLITGVIIYGLTIIVAFSSPYMGAVNVASGAAGLAILHRDFALPIGFDTLSRLLHLSFGYPLLVLVGLGLIVSMTIREERGAAAAAGLCVVTGIWFWIFATGPTANVRYVLPFGVMAFIILVPSLVRTISCLPAWLRVSAAAAIMAPTAAISLLLLGPRPPADWQQLLGINLSSGVFRAEDEQAVALLSKLQEEGTPSALVYFLGLSSPARCFGAALSYWTFVNQGLPRVTVQLPVNWQSTTTYRFSELALADYVVFSPMRDDAQLRQLLDSRSVPDLNAENLLMKAWFSSLTPTDGVDMVSETRVRLLRIAHRARFQQALQRLRAAYDWRAEFRAANPLP